MRRFARRLPGSRVLTTPAMLAVLLTLSVGMVGAGVAVGYRAARGQAEALPMMALDSRAQPAAATDLAPVPILPPTPDPIAPEHAPAPTPDTPDQQIEQPVKPAAADVATSAAANDETTAMRFDGRPLRKVRTITMKVTAYSPDARSCGKWADGVTASGYSVWTNGMKLAAADTRVLPFNTIITIPGYNGGKPVPVLDRGGAIKGNRLDVLYPTHEVALQWGVQDLEVDVWEYAD